MTKTGCDSRYDTLRSFYGGWDLVPEEPCGSRDPRNYLPDTPARWLHEGRINVSVHTTRTCPQCDRKRIMSGAPARIEWKMAAACLESLQQEVYRNQGLFPYHMQMSEEEHARRKEMFIEKSFNQQGGHYTTNPLNFFQYRKDMYEFFSRMKQSCPSRFQEPEWYSHVTRLHREIDGALDDTRRPARPVNCLFGTLPTGMERGMYVLAPETDYVLVLFDDGLFGFASMVSRAVAEIFPQDPGRTRPAAGLENEISGAFLAHPEVTLHFANILAAYLVRGDPRFAPRYMPGLESEGFAETLRHSMEIFILGRELGHLYGGHVLPEKREETVFCGATIEQVPFPADEEYHADFSGLYSLLATTVQGKSSLSFSYAGLDLFLGSAGLLRKARQVLSSGQVTAEENIPREPHSPDIRRQRMRELLESNLGSEAAAYPVQMAKINSLILETLWSQCEPKLVELHRAGVKPAAKWQMQDGS